SKQPSSVVRLDLFDPAGRFAAFSDPQSAPGLSSGFGQVIVRNPGPGVWKAVIWTKAAATPGSYAGAVRLSVNGSRFKAAGTVAPAALVLPPGHRATFTVNTHTPAGPGDRDQQVVFPVPAGSGTLMGAIPVGLRALIPLRAMGGSFSGTLTGGNGRLGAPGQTLSYQFDVPAGLRDLELGLRIVDPSSNLEGVLVDPAGQPIDVQTMAAAISTSGLPSFFTGKMQFFRRDPLPGRWLFVLLINDAVGGAATAQTFKATIAFNGVKVRASGIPNSGRVVLPAGKPVMAAIQVLNSGLTTKDFFVDPRLATTGLVPLQAPHSYSVTLPITKTQMLPPFTVPPQVSTLTFTAHAPTPVSFDAFAASGTPPFGATGSPDIYQSTGSQVDNAAGDFTASIVVQAPEVAPGLWQTLPEQHGPFGASGAAPSTVDVGVSALGQPFDRQVATTTGDMWSPFAVQYRPLTLSPGHQGIIGVQITPRGLPGTRVSGFLYLDTFNPNSASGDELAAIPYAYTIGRKRAP
ncbi:MAG: Subtilase family protease/peptidase inhibitor, partial [Chloroflexi bacterium]|nr:Subtilase family protease/peptidase inhibitor [Chloroflexota bacterium]